MFGREKLPVKTPEQILLMRRAGLVVGRCLELLAGRAAAGMTTGELDRVAEEFIRDQGATPSFLGYQGFPGSLCVSVNEQVVHGIPGDRPLADGDLVSIDCGAIVDGWHGDAAITLVVGGDAAARPEDVALSAATRRALWAGIGALRPGIGIYELGGVIQDSVEASELEDELTYGIVDGYTGHGIGTSMHMEPTVYNERVRPRGPIVRTGATVAIEPMVTLGTHASRELDDEWTVVTEDGSRAAHWEHTVAVTDGGLWVLTAVDGGAADLAQVGAAYGPLE
ncbi:type I methionyl aminopeptidase [Flexivirga sp. ID2601S]|uniref:Methionine aminopeptidase n=1 Tax=Flexivirga aerilata TaxID=1656889 RepID=A0A849AKX4_9MICO|nr:type I methionyl aminopeptidase [Flexivirga aerilata]NNG39040.1 type I methionyl aminopeptidase [Flexivirga aerilata]